MSELPTRFPETSFIEQVTDGMHPQGVDLVRAAYVGYCFGQQDADLTRRFGVQAAHEVRFWLPYEKQDYTEAQTEADIFFSNRGADALAQASFKAANLRDSDFMRIGRVMHIDNAWQACRKSLPSQRRLDETPSLSLVDAHQELTRVKRAWSSKIRLTRDFLTIDTSAANSEGGPLGLVPRLSHQSFFREAVLMERPTGTKVFDFLFSLMRDHAATGQIAPQLAKLEAVWSRHHSEDFWPKNAD